MFPVLYIEIVEITNTQTARVILKFTMVKVAPNWIRSKINKVGDQIVRGIEPLTGTKTRLKI